MSDAVTYFYFSHAELRVSVDRCSTACALRRHHTTEYDYSESVAVAHHVARLRPRDLPNQECRLHELAIAPAPAVRPALRRLFRQSRHLRRCPGRAHAPRHPCPQQRRASPARRCPMPGDTPLGRPPIAARCRSRRSSSRSIRHRRARREIVEAYARAVVSCRTAAARSRPRPDSRIHAEFTFDPKATTVATPLTEVFNGAARRLPGLRAARDRLPAIARPSGAVHQRLHGNRPPPGKPRLVGADASHAWLTFYCPDVGWIPVDPTNNLLPSDTHITLAWGRDFNDVSPIRGVILGGGAHALKVQVDVVPARPARGPDRAQAISADEGLPLRSLRKPAVLREHPMRPLRPRGRVSARSGNRRLSRSPTTTRIPTGTWRSPLRAAAGKTYRLCRNYSN